MFPVRDKPGRAGGDAFSESYEASGMTRLGKLCRNFGFQVHLLVSGHVFVARDPVNGDRQSGSLLLNSPESCPERSE